MKDKRIQIRIEERFYKKIEEKAEAVGMNVSEFITFMAVNGNINCHAGKSPEIELVQELRAIDQVQRIGGVETSFEFLEKRRELVYKNYIEKVKCTDENQKQQKVYTQAELIDFHDRMPKDGELICIVYPPEAKKIKTILNFSKDVKIIDGMKYTPVKDSEKPFK